MAQTRVSNHDKLLAALGENRLPLAGKMAALVADWRKYAEEYAADPDGFAGRESASLVEYLIQFARTGDESYRHLYIGEKAKQFYHADPAIAADEARRCAIIKAERQVVLAVVAADDVAGRTLVDAFYDQVDRALTAPVSTEMKVLFVGDCLYLDVIAFLTTPLLEDGIRVQPSFITSKSPWEQRAAIAKLSDQKFDAIFVSPFTYAFNTQYSHLDRIRGTLISPTTLRREMQAAFDETAITLDTLVDLFDCNIFVHDVAPISRHSETFRDHLRLAITGPARRAAAKLLSNRISTHIAAQRAKGASNLHLIEEQALLAGSNAYEAGRLFHFAGLQHPAVYGRMVAKRYRDLLFVEARLMKRKLVVCDLDNTLWEGVIGEKLGVRHHRDRQETLLRLKARGIVLAINSKNDEKNVVWEGDGALLCATDFVSSQINWQPKVLNMRQIAQHLNLKEKDFIFIDDRADERALMSEAYPKLLALDALDDRAWQMLALWADLLPENPNADRTDFYKQRDARQAFLADEQEGNAAEQAKLFGSLGLKATIREADASDLTRVAELINRTNQFNMDGSRISTRETAAYHDDPASRILVIDAADRFGTMGTISVMIVTREGTDLVIPVFVLSCRVFGYGIEHAAIEAARKLATGHEGLIGRFRVTEFNEPCHSVYPENGFIRIEGGWRLDNAAAASLKLVDWLSVSESVTPLTLAVEAA